ncbi:hypothetical protein BD413DRAFT_677347 [Trametes elegans]|nr:hypothetical protein BD413DRAFT_677347 [Trametes elegans]
MAPASKKHNSPQENCFAHGKALPAANPTSLQRRTATAKLPQRFNFSLSDNAETELGVPAPGGSQTALNPVEEPAPGDEDDTQADILVDIPEQSELTDDDEPISNLVRNNKAIKETATAMDEDFGCRKQMYKSLWLGPSSVTSARAGVTSNRSAGHPPLIVSYDITQVKPCTIAYVAVLIHFALNSQNQWSRKDMGFDCADFYNNLLGTFESPSWSEMTPKCAVSGNNKPRVAQAMSPAQTLSRPGLPPRSWPERRPQLRSKGLHVGHASCSPSRTSHQ